MVSARDRSLVPRARRDEAGAGAMALVGFDDLVVLTPPVHGYDPDPG